MTKETKEMKDNIEKGLKERFELLDTCILLLKIMETEDEGYYNRNIEVINNAIETIKRLS